MHCCSSSCIISNTFITLTTIYSLKFRILIFSLYLISKTLFLFQKIDTPTHTYSQTSTQYIKYPEPRFYLLHQNISDSLNIQKIVLLSNKTSTIASLCRSLAINHFLLILGLSLFTVSDITIKTRPIDLVLTGPCWLMALFFECLIIHFSNLYISLEVFYFLYLYIYTLDYFLIDIHKF